MFKVIFQLLILLYVILLIFNLLELKKYNINGIIVECDNYQEVLFNIKNLKPVCFNGNDSIEIKDDLPNNYNVFKQTGLIINSNLSISKDLLNQKKKMLFFNDSITIHNHKDETNLEQCIHNYNILSILSGETKIYLFNPKHKDDIINKKKYEIKKWSHKKY